MVREGISIDVLVNTLVEFSIRVRGFIFIPLLTGFLGVAAFGVYTQVLAVTRILQLVFGLGLFSSLVRFSAELEREVREVYYPILLVSILSGLIAYSLIYISSDTISVLVLNSDEYSTVFEIGGLLILTRIVLKLQEDVYRAQRQMKIYSLIRGVEAYGAIISVAIALWIFNDLIAVFTLLVVSEILLTILLQVIIILKIGCSMPTFKAMAQYLRYSIPVAISSLAGNVSSRVDRLLIGYFLGPAPVGVYSIAYQLGVAITVYVYPIRTVFFPELSSLIERGEQAEITSILNKGLRYFLIIAVPTIAGLYITSDQLIKILMGASEQVPSSALIATIAIGLTFHGIDQIFVTALNAYKRTGVVSVIRSTAAVLNITLNIMVIPILGVLGAAYTTVLTYIFTFIITYVLLKQHTGITFQYKSILRITLSASIMLIVLANSGIKSIIIMILTGTLLYFTLIFSLRELRLSDLKGLVG